MRILKIYLLVILFTLTFGCGQDHKGGEMPEDSKDWVCVSEEPLTQDEIKSWCDNNSGKGKPLPPGLRKPSPISDLDAKNSYDVKLREFAFERFYDTELSWVRDKNVRFTGPYVGELGKGLSYGTHAAIRIYYSPEVVDWLCGGREGRLPDGAVILKEEYAFDEALDVKTGSEGCMEVGPGAKPELIGYSVMVKSEESSYDGWYWAAFFKVFGEPQPWQQGNPPVVDRSAIVDKSQFYIDGNPPAASNPLWYPTGTDFFTENKIPSVVYPLLEDETGDAPELVNLSVYGEWSVSPMGLSGRDPVFYAQLESETNNLPGLTECIETICLHCHGVTGVRAYAEHTSGQGGDGCRDLFGVEPLPEVPNGDPFRLDMMKVWPGSDDNSLQHFGALGRDGVSCMACHRIAKEGLDKESAYTGNFLTGPADEVYGQYDDVITKPMQNVLGLTPKYGSQAEDPALCGSCHNILLPVFGNGGTRLGFKYEQTTHLEWKNSVYSKQGSDFKTCQNCHMPGNYKGEELTFKIANITSNEFPPSYNVLPDSEITLKERPGYPRHSLHGLNLFLNQMFQQFPIILGARQIDYMVGTATVNPSLVTGQESMIYMAQNETAEVRLKELHITDDGELHTEVEVTNLTGHYLPSGVGFRRMFLEFLVRDSDGNVLWASGQTNSLGVIVDGTTDNILSSEDPIKFPEAPFQPHYEVITKQDQVQIYQELVEDSEGDLTTSFLRRVTEVKDNRIRPKGYNPEYYKDSGSEFIKSLSGVIGKTKNDPHYTDPSLTGSDIVQYRISLDKDLLEKVHDVKVTLYNQSIPPFYLQERFRDAYRGPAERDEIERLYYITSHLNVDGVLDDQGASVLSDWKLLITSQTKTLH